MGPQVYEIMEALHRARASSLDKPAGWGGSPAAGPADATALERASSGGRGGDRRGRRGAGAGGKPAMRGDSADGGASAGGMHSELPAGGGLVGGRLGGDGARGSAAAAARALLLAKLPWPPAGPAADAAGIAAAAPRPPTAETQQQRVRLAQQHPDAWQEWRRLSYETSLDEVREVATAAAAAATASSAEAEKAAAAGSPLCWPEATNGPERLMASAADARARLANNGNTAAGAESAAAPQRPSVLKRLQTWCRQQRSTDGDINTPAKSGMGGHSAARNQPQ